MPNHVVLSLWASMAAAGASASPAAAKHNVLYFIADDLRPEFLGPYGQVQLKTPNVDKLASEGLVFNAAYCQQAVCGPSRASFMTGRRPAHTNVFDNNANFRVSGRDLNGDGATWITMPEHFKRSGWLTLGLGKTFHPNHPTDWDEPTSWSPDMPYYDYSYFIQPNTSKTAYPSGSKQPCPGAGLPTKGAGPSDIDVWCRVDEPHEHFYDFGLANATVARIKYANSVLKSKGTPFFIQAGFARPHAPWRVPADFWDLYATEDIALPQHRLPPENMPGIAWMQNGFYRAADPTQIILPQITSPIDELDTKTMRHAYYAAVSWLDHNLGIVLDSLDAEGLKDNTVVLLHGDHGWQLGEHDSWHKFTNFELGTRVPLIMRAPFIKTSVGKKAEIFAELVDMYPTVAELAGTPAPSNHVDGVSLAPVFADPTIATLPSAGIATSNKTYAYSQYPHDSDHNCPWFRGGECFQAPNGADATPHGRALLAQLERQSRFPPPAGNKTSYMGFSVRDKAFRYTAWLPWLDKSQEPDWTAEPFRELYDHSDDTGRDFDAMDVVNVAYVPSYASVTTALHAQCRFFFHTLLPQTGHGSGNQTSSEVSKAECDQAGGILSRDQLACCPTKCGQCGGKGCETFPGGNENCCSGEVEKSTRRCKTDPAPCH